MSKYSIFEQEKKAVLESLEKYEFVGAIDKKSSKKIRTFLENKDIEKAYNLFLEKAILTESPNDLEDFDFEDLLLGDSSDLDKEDDLVFLKRDLVGQEGFSKEQVEQDLFILEKLLRLSHHRRKNVIDVIEAEYQKVSSFEIIAYKIFRYSSRDLIKRAKEQPNFMTWEQQDAHALLYVKNLKTGIVKGILYNPESKTVVVSVGGPEEENPEKVFINLTKNVDIKYNPNRFRDVLESLVYS